MAEHVKIFRVFVASPNDVADERERLTGVVAELNRTIGAKVGARLELVRWETDVLPGFGVDAQDVVNRQITPCEVFIGVISDRLGTATKRARSGTVEEIERALASFTATGRPWLMLYFRRGPSVEPAVLEFRDELSARGGLYREYDEPEEFTAMVREHLAKQLYELTQSNAASSAGRLLKGPLLETYRYLVGDVLSACRNLVRVADDLHTNSDHYLALHPSTPAVFAEQVADIGRSITAYNEGWQRVYRQRVDFEETIQALQGTPALRDLVSKALNRLLDFERGYDAPPAVEASRFAEQFDDLSSGWRETRVGLHSRLVRAREALEEVERFLEEIATAEGNHAPEPQPQSAWEAAGLLIDYRDEVAAFAAGVAEFSSTSRADGAELSAAAWRLLAPGILGTNGSFTILQERSLLLRLTLLASGASDPAYAAGVALIKRAERFQWHELRPQVNGLVSLVIPIVHGDHRESTIRRLTARASQLRELEETLRHGARRLDPASAFPRA